MAEPLPEPPARPQRIAYLGTPAMAVPPLRALHRAGFEITSVITGPDKRRGRRSEPSPTPVKEAAQELGLPVSHRVEDALDAGAGVGVVVAFGQMLRRPVLERLPMVNLHFSLLPRWRGAAPVERALMAGDDVTGVCVMAVDETLDTGAVYSSVEVPIGPRATASELRRDLTEVGAKLLVDALRRGLEDPTPQDGEVTYAEKIRPVDLALDWTQPAVYLDRLVRVGGAWTLFRGKRFKVHEATPSSERGVGSPGQVHGTRVTCGDGSLDLAVVQPEGKGRIDAAAWINGARPEPGEAFHLHADPGGATT